MIEEIVQKNDIEGQNKIVNRSLDKILIAHRNSKLFLFMMTGPFFILFKIVWYIIKFGVLFLLIKKGKGVATHTEGNVANKVVTAV